MVKVVLLVLISLNLGCAAIEKWNEGARAQHAQKAEEKRLAQYNRIELISQKLKPLPHGVLKAPQGIGDDLIKQRIKEFCTNNAQSSWEVVEIKTVQEYLGNKGSGFASCSGAWCAGSQNSNAVYAKFDEVSFECKGS